MERELGLKKQVCDNNNFGSILQNEWECRSDVHLDIPQRVKKGQTKLMVMAEWGNLHIKCTILCMVIWIMTLVDKSESSRVMSALDVLQEDTSNIDLL